MQLRIENTIIGLSLTKLAAITALIAALIVICLPASAQITPSEIEDPARRCQALTLMSYGQAADMPANIVSSTYYKNEPATAREKRFFHKRGISQGNPTPAGMEEFPEHCRVEGYITNHIKFSLMLPAPDAWNDKFMLGACDAWCGKVHTDITVPGLYDGYATITNDGGHYSRAPFDGIWSYKDEKAKVNFAYLANHLSAQLGKAISKDYYGSDVTYAYIAGFSKGGNAGLMTAQRYPEDFDGVFVKAPVVPYNEKNAVHLTWILKAVYPHNDYEPVLYSDKAPLVDDAVLAACDGLDGVVNSIIDDPRLCKFDPIELLCKEGESELLNECLNMEQVTAVRKIYSPPMDKDGNILMNDRVAYGTESDWARTFLPVRGADEPTFIHTAGPSGIRYMVMDDAPGPDYDWREFYYPRDKSKMIKTSAMMNPDSPDLKEFKARGGKMIIVHGWADALIGPYSTVEWFDKMKAYMGAEETSEFAQLYLVPGMHHGSGGHGPHVFDALSPLEKWVEEGIAPTELLMTDEPDAKVYRERIFYPYPATSVYKGEGDPNLASSFKRADP